MRKRPLRATVPLCLGLAHSQDQKPITVNQARRKCTFSSPHGPMPPFSRPRSAGGSSGQTAFRASFLEGASLKPARPTAASPREPAGVGVKLGSPAAEARPAGPPTPAAGGARDGFIFMGSLCVSQNEPLCAQSAPMNPWCERSKKCFAASAISPISWVCASELPAGWSKSGVSLKQLAFPSALCAGGAVQSSGGSQPDVPTGESRVGGAPFKVGWGRQYVQMSRAIKHLPTPV